MSATIEKREFIENLRLKLKALRVKQKELKAALETEFNFETYRALSIVNHKIRVTTERKKGGWKKADLLPLSMRILK